MTRDPKYLPALISAPRLHGFRRSSHCERQEASRFPNPAKKLVPKICSWQEGARNHAGLQQRKRRQGEKLWLDRPGGLASISGLRSGRIVIPAALTPLESPPLPTPSIPGAAGPGGLALPGVQGPRAGRRQVEGDRLTAARPREAGPGGAAATPALPLPTPPALLPQLSVQLAAPRALARPPSVSPATGEAAAAPRRHRGAVSPRQPRARPSPRPLPSARPSPPPLAAGGLPSPGLLLRGPRAGREPGRLGAGEAAHSTDTHCGRTDPGGARRAPWAPRRRAPLPPPPVSPGSGPRGQPRRAGGPRGGAGPAGARRWRSRSAPARTPSPPPPAPSRRTSPPPAAASPTTASSSAPCPDSSSWRRS